ncbi:MAG: LTA synthase family protein [Anaerovoracaceae bacterium]|jgi:phosphoglycerol transferase MdoB-like AlkP superfamily enzyme
MFDKIKSRLMSNKFISAFISKYMALVAVIYKYCDKIFGRPAEFIRKCQSKPVLYTIYHSFIIYLAVEMLSRRSFIQGFVFLFSHPLVFLYNWILVMATLSLALLFKRRGFAFTAISLVWIILGIADCVLLSYRTTPLNFMDFRTLKDVFGIVNVYTSAIFRILIIIGIIVFAIVMVNLLIKAKKSKVVYKKAVVQVLCFCLLLGGATVVSVNTGTIITTFHNIQDAYKEYGFAYCFAASVVDRGVSKPDNYSQESIQAIVDKINQEAGDAAAAEVVKSDEATTSTPNIIFLQMESFFDPTTLKGVTFSENPLPNFQSMKENYTSGYLTTPSFGAGTANTEYEVNTGFSIANFGPGEYPYTTIMRETTSESIANDLKGYGYATHAIHNHTGKFYGRYLVYPNLGFDTFTSVEYMQNVERNPLNWAKDYILTGEINKALQSTSQQDYIFAVSVQGHGKYPTEKIDDTQTITVDGFNEDEAVGFEYYVNQIHQMDEFLGQLTDSLSQSSEPTVLVVYGDHLPKFNITNDDVVNGNIYQTEYVIWDNFGLPEEDKDLTTYQLGAYVMKQLGLHNGIVNLFQQYCTDDSDYYSNLHALQYDMLYGESYATNGVKYEKTDMTFGIDDITIDGLSVVGDKLYVTGQNFTEASKIFINGTQVSTEFLNSGRISCDYGKEIQDGDTVEVIQMSSKKTQLSSAGTWTWYSDGSVQTGDPVDNISIDKEESEESIKSDIKQEENYN